MSLMLLAGLFTLLNACKPLLIDDTAYYYFAEHITQDPLHPYDFDIFWYEAPQPANTVLAPPVFLYWWALGMTLLGDHPVLWKLWLFPFAWLFAWSLHALFQRFARGLELPLTWMTVLSPTFLPSLNLMLDVPALALSLTALTLFFSACDRRWLPSAVVAGLIAGLAMETKYTAFTAPVAMLTYGVIHRRPVLGLIAAGIAIYVFVGCEMLLAMQHGESHFLVNLNQTIPGNDVSFIEKLRNMIFQKLHLVLPSTSILGCLTPFVIILSLIGLGVHWSKIMVTGVVLAFGYWVITFLDVAVTLNLDGTPHGTLSQEQLIYGCYGILLALTTLASIVYLGWQAPTCGFNWFLLLWLLLEIGASLAMTPFPAVRRVMGIVVVLTLLAGRLASQRLEIDTQPLEDEDQLSEEPCDQRPEVRLLVLGAMLGSILLGLVFFGVDYLGAAAQQHAAESARKAIARWSRDNNQPVGTVWYVGHWGFQFYAERQGMRPVVPYESPLVEGDWLVVPEWNVHKQELRIDHDCVVKTHDSNSLTQNDFVPLQTIWNYYSGSTPLEHRRWPRVGVTIYRVKEPFNGPIRR